MMKLPKTRKTLEWAGALPLADPGFEARLAEDIAAAAPDAITSPRDTLLILDWVKSLGLSEEEAGEARKRLAGLWRDRRDIPAALAAAGIPAEGIAEGFAPNAGLLGLFRKWKAGDGDAVPPSVAEAFSMLEDEGSGARASGGAVRGPLPGGGEFRLGWFRNEVRWKFTAPDGVVLELIGIPEHFDREASAILRNGARQFRPF